MTYTLKTDQEKISVLTTQLYGKLPNPKVSLNSSIGKNTLVKETQDLSFLKKDLRKIFILTILALSTQLAISFGLSRGIFLKLW